MEYKNIVAIIGLLMVAAGVVMAISGVTPTQVGAQSRWSGNSSGSITTQGGNITAVNIAGTTLTAKWADFYGNVTGGIILGNGLGTNVYSWTFTSTTSGRVCLTTNSSWITTAVPSAATGANIDTSWGFAPTDSDSGTNTYSTNNCNLNLSGGSVTGTGNVTLQGNSTFNDCVVSNGIITSGILGNVAFCTNTQSSASGKNYYNVSSNYEIMVAVNKTSTGTYYFYAELG